MNNLPTFKDGDVICFFGDSITANGTYMAEIYQTLKHTVNVKCYNCGVPGATAYDSEPRLYTHCLIHNPTYVVMMFGINDITREKYADSCLDPNKEKIKSDSIIRHKQSYEWLVKEIISHGATPIMCLPVPYDDISEVTAENYNCSKGLLACIDCVKEIQKEYGGYIVDFYNVMYAMLNTKKVIGDDRVHPTTYGYHVMAQTFMQQMGILENTDYDNPFIIEEWNRKRYDVERPLERLNFVDYCILSPVHREGKLTLDERKELIKKRYDAEPNKKGFIPEAYDFYLKNIDFKEKIIAEVIKHTI